MLVTCAMASRYIDTIRTPGLVEEDEEMSIVSLSDMEAGFSGNHSFFSKPSKARGCHMAFSHCLTASSRSGEEHHFLASCFLCKKPIGENRDIFMYRGDTPFCSAECRQEQIDVDEGMEMKRQLPIKVSSSLSSSSSSRKEQQKGPTRKTHNYHARTGTVAAG